MKLLVQNDDYGITPGVSAGIRRAIQKGIVKNTGMFVNMPSSYEDAKEVKKMDVCLGIDINYVCGKSVSPIEKIPHMVKETGEFYSSEEMRKHSKLISAGEMGIVSHFENDPYPYEEIYLETENQVKRFIDMVGKKPEYMHMHSLVTPNALKAALDVAKKYEIYHSIYMMRSYAAVAGTFDGANGNSLESQIDYNTEENLLSGGLEELREGETKYFICHGGYVDYELFQYTSLTTRRIRDLQAMLSERVKECIKNKGIELITYRDLEGENKCKKIK